MVNRLIQSHLKLIIYGAGGHATSVGSLALSLGYNRIVFVDEGKAGEYLHGYPVSDLRGALQAGQPQKMVIAVGDNYSREATLTVLDKLGVEIDFPCLIHPTAILCTGANVSAGTVVMPGAIIGANSIIGTHCLINSGAIVDHDCTLRDFSSVGPGSTLCGRVFVGRRSAVCAGAVIEQGKRVGNDSVIGALSFVNKDIPSNVLAFGSPVLVKKSRKPQEAYLK